MSTNLEILDNQKLYKLCKFYGEQAKKWRYKFMGLLPEVHRRKLYEKKGFNSVFEFAKKLAGLSEEQVQRVLNLEKKFEETPVLKNLLTNGEVSVNKLARVASIATKENEEALAMQVKILPQAALETLVHDEKFARKEQEFKNTNGLLEPFFEEKSVRAHRNGGVSERSDMGVKREQNVKLKLSEEVQQKLFELQQKGINVNQLILEMLQKRELEILQEKEQIADEMSGNINTKAKTQWMHISKPTLADLSETPPKPKFQRTHLSIIPQKSTRPQKVSSRPTFIKAYSGEISSKPSRYIPIKIKKLLHKEYGNKCSIPNCPKPAENIHHTQRFSLSGTHDPRYLAPLCRNHHIIAHSIDVRFQQKRRLALA